MRGGLPLRGRRSPAHPRRWSVRWVLIGQPCPPRRSAGTRVEASVPGRPRSRTAARAPDRPPHGTAPLAARRLESGADRAHPVGILRGDDPTTDVARRARLRARGAAGDVGGRDGRPAAAHAGAQAHRGEGRGHLPAGARRRRPTGRQFCDVFTGREPVDGILIKIPPHRGEAKLLFDLHNRQTYSEEQVKAGRAYARYTAFVGVLTMNNDLVARAVVQSEFRTAKDLFDRVGGGAGPSGLKAVAPLSVEPVTVVLPDKVDEVSLLGEKLEVERVDGRFTYASPGQVVAIVSNIRIRIPARARAAAALVRPQILGACTTCSSSVAARPGWPPPSRPPSPTSTTSCSRRACSSTRSCTIRPTWCSSPRRSCSRSADPLHQPAREADAAGGAAVLPQGHRHVWPPIAFGETVTAIRRTDAGFEVDARRADGTAASTGRGRWWPRLAPTTIRTAWASPARTCRTSRTTTPSRTWATASRSWWWAARTRRRRRRSSCSAPARR